MRALWKVESISLGNYREGKREVSSNSSQPRAFIVVPYSALANNISIIQNIKEPGNLADDDFLLLRRNNPLKNKKPSEWKFKLAVLPGPFNPLLSWIGLALSSFTFLLLGESQRNFSASELLRFRETPLFSVVINDF